MLKHKVCANWGNEEVGNNSGFFKGEMGASAEQIESSKLSVLTFNYSFPYLHLFKWLEKNNYI